MIQLRISRAITALNHAIRENFKWGIGAHGHGYDIALKAGCEIGCNMEPQTVAELAQRQDEENAAKALKSRPRSIFPVGDL